MDPIYYTVLTVNGEVYGRLTKKDIPDILAKYKA